MSKEASLEEALSHLHQTDPSFTQELRSRLAPVKDRFFAPPSRKSPADHKDDLRTPPPYMIEPDLRKVAIEIAELALERGIGVNVAVEDDGSTFLHLCTLLSDPAIALEAVEWLLAHGADPNRRRNDGQTPLTLAMTLGRVELVNLMGRGPSAL